jgi:Uma2 family endonuclease
MVARHLASPTARRLTRAEFDRMGELQFFRGERVELIHGTVVRMAPIGPTHSTVVQRLAELLLPRLLGRATVRIQQPLVARDESAPEPDIAVVPLGSYLERHPDGALLVIEVAESALEYDRNTKRPLYAASNVNEYWIVDVAGRAIEISTDRDGQQYKSLRRAVGSEILRPVAFADVVIVVADLLP